MQFITPHDLYNYVMNDAKIWCNTRKENEIYHKVYDLFETANLIITGSYHYTDKILEVLKDES